MFGVMWLWQSKADSRGRPGVDYSTLYTWAEQGRLASATLKGRRLVGTLHSPATVDGRQVSQFRTELPEHDDSLLPLLRAKGIRILVEPDRPPVAGRLVLDLLPWILIIGAWWWVSRHAQGHDGAGRAVRRARRRSKSRRFDKRARST